MASRFLWIDLETTGLDPHTGSVLEVAVVGVDDDGPMMPELARHSMVIQAGAREITQADDFVRDMHSKNGLWVECASPHAVTLANAESALCSFVQGESLAPPKGIVLAGGSVHFDLAWIRVHFPTFAKCLSHRVFDVSTLKAAERTWGAQFPDIKGTDHRALSDVLASLEEARAIRARRWW